MNKKYTHLLFFLVMIPSFLILKGCDQTDQTLDEKVSEHTDDEDSGESEIKILPGFEVEVLYEVPRKTQGTWVSLTMDEQGRLIASAEDKQGTYWIDVEEDHEKDTVMVKVTEMILPATGAQGLAWYKDQLYANVNGKGLFRMSKSKGSGVLDEMKFLGGPESPSDHGNHALVPAPDGKSLYVVNGNHTPPPADFTSHVLNWEEDILLTRQWDARGHAAGVLAPGGYIARIDPDARQWDILSMGYRNTYDLAIHPNGELFTFDSDMEWDMGMPWYRPTRILHVVSGSDYGWRSGSGKWKTFYEDSHPSVLDVGPASPTGVLFGTGARFPAKYQKALFGLDWTYGTIYAFHLTPNGASYTATAEEFLSGQALAVADAIIGQDGAMYFITGGWSNDTKLYRITYTGTESIEPVQYEENSEAVKARTLRHMLESFHGHRDSRAVTTAWPYLADEDRFIRNAARVAIEFQPVNSWIGRARVDTRPQAIITSTVALARAADSSYKEEALDILMKLDFGQLSTMQKLGYLRTLSLIFMRLGDPDTLHQKLLKDLLSKSLPDQDERVNIELVRLLIYLKDPRIITVALDLIKDSKVPAPPDWGAIVKRNNKYGGTVAQMLENPPPANKLEYLFMLRNMTAGWTLDQRKIYFSMIYDAADAMGGQSYWGFLERMRDEALLGVSDDDRVALADIISQPIAKGPDFEVKPIEGPGRDWSVDQALKVVESSSGKRDFDLGRNAFFATGCASCHRFDGMGGDIGPDLGSVGNRFATMKILEDIITPSETISDLYGSSKVTLSSGRTLEGLVVKDEEFIKVYSRNPDRAPDIVPSVEVQSIEPVAVSQMPPGLINSLNADELRSLIAYLQSGGDEEDDVFE